MGLSKSLQAVDKGGERVELGKRAACLINYGLNHKRVCLCLTNTQHVVPSQRVFVVHLL